MQTNSQLWSHLAHFFLQWEMFRTAVVYKIKTYTFCSVNFFQKIVGLWHNVENIVEQDSRYNTAHLLCVLDNQGYRQTLRICGTYCLPTSTVVTRSCLIVAFVCRLHCVTVCLFVCLIRGHTLTFRQLRLQCPASERWVHNELTGMGKVAVLFWHEAVCRYRLSTTQHWTRDVPVGYRSLRRPCLMVFLTFEVAIMACFRIWFREV